MPQTSYRGTFLAWAGGELVSAAEAQWALWADPLGAAHPAVDLALEGRGEGAAVWWGCFWLKAGRKSINMDLYTDLYMSKKICRSILNSSIDPLIKGE